MSSESLPTSITAPCPTLDKQRIDAIDSLRGFALLGILMLNILVFGLPAPSQNSPIADGGTEGINLYTFMFVDVFFEGGMRALFSILFGAGVILFTLKPDASISTADLYFRRTLWLMAFGLVDAYIFLWPGDILFCYGLAGLFLYVFRNLGPSKLITIAVVIVAILATSRALEFQELKQLRTDVIAIETLPEDTELSADQKGKINAWNQYLTGQLITEERLQATHAFHQQGYLAHFQVYVPINISRQSSSLYTGALWDVLAMMLIGMALLKWQVLNASRSVRFYGLLTAVGFGIGLPINYFEVSTFVNSGFEHYLISGNRATYDLGRLANAFGYIGLIMLICKMGMLAWLMRGLAAVGRLALTNYLAHSLICNTLFFGFGFGLFGSLERHQLYYVVGGICLFQFIFSQLWLRYYRFGPVEWLWRSLTYWRKQPMLATKPKAAHSQDKMVEGSPS